MPRDDDRTRALTGQDAPIETAQRGTAGSGAKPFDADSVGLGHLDDSDARALIAAETEDADTGDAAEDILPDKLEQGASDGLTEDDHALSARPHEALRPLTPDLLPSQDLAAATFDEDDPDRDDTV